MERERGSAAMRHASHWRGVELRHIEALAAIVAEGSFSRAARRLGYSQSAISQQVAALERIVGHRVLERSSGAQAVVPTPVGNVVLAHGEQIARQISSARAEVEALATTGAAVLRVGASALTATPVLAPAVAQLRSRSPDVVIEVEEGLRDSELLEDVLRGRLDVALVHEPLDEPEVESRPLYSDELAVLVGGRMHPLEKTLTAQDLERLPFAGLTRSGPVEDALAALRAAGVSLNVVVRTSCLGALCGLVAQGTVAALLPKSVATAELRARRVEIPLPPRTVAVAWRRDATSRRSVPDFISAAEAAGAAFRRARGLDELAA